MFPFRYSVKTRERGLRMTSVDPDFGTRGNQPDPNVIEDAFLAQGYEDFWSGPPATKKFFLADGKQYLEFRPMTWGDRNKYQSLTSTAVDINHKTRDMRLQPNTGRDNRELILMSTVDWHVVRFEPRQGKYAPVPFTKNGPGSNLDQWLNQADPNLVDAYLAAIQEANPWLKGERTSAEIREEIQRLNDELVLVERDEAAKNS